MAAKARAGCAMGLAGALVTALALAAPATSAVARETLQCFAAVPGVTARGVPTTFRYEDGKVSSERRGPDDLGYQPRDVAFPHVVTSRAGGRSALVRSYWFTVSGSQLREVTEIDRRDAKGLLVSAEYHTRVVRKHWGGVRQISIGKDRDHLYVLTNTDQLLRYRIKGKNGDAAVRLNATVGVGFGTLGTFEYSRSVSAFGGTSDVFLATDADSGELLEYTIPVQSPSAYTRTVLATGGWSDMRSAGRTASCFNPSAQREYDGIVAVDIGGAVRLWTDRDGTDGRGNDIVYRGVLKSVWKPLAYND